MNHFNFPPDFRRCFEKAVNRYAKGTRDPDALFTAEEKTWLAANGMTPQHLYDYAEDHTHYGGEPTCDQALAIELVRRDYFLNVQHGRPSVITLDPGKLPAKTDAVGGMPWLPRLLPKSRAKLRGELPSSLMFGCSGDRKFFQEHNILPSEFLGAVWRHEGNDAAVVDWVKHRTSAP